MTAQASRSASSPSATVSLVLQQNALAINNQFDPDGTGFASILIRASASSTTDAINAKVTSTTTFIGRFDGSKFNFTPTTYQGLDTGWNVLGFGDVTGRNISSLISRNSADDVRVDTSEVSIILRKAKSD